MRPIATECPPGLMRAVRVQAKGAWMLVAVIPLDLGPLVRVSPMDYADWPGYGVVLSVDTMYFHLPETERWKSKTGSWESRELRKNVRYEHDVRPGDRVLFRRYLRSQAVLQPASASQVLEDEATLPDGWELLFLHVDDCIGTWEVENGTTTDT